MFCRCLAQVTRNTVCRCVSSLDGPEGGLDFFFGIVVVVHMRVIAYMWYFGCYNVLHMHGDDVYGTSGWEVSTGYLRRSYVDLCGIYEIPEDVLRGRRGVYGIPRQGKSYVDFHGGCLSDTLEESYGDSWLCLRDTSRCEILRGSHGYVRHTGTDPTRIRWCLRDTFTRVPRGHEESHAGMHMQTCWLWDLKLHLIYNMQDTYIIYIYTHMSNLAIIETVASGT